MKPIRENGSKLLQQMKELESKIGEGKKKKRMKLVEFLIKESGALTNEFSKNILRDKKPAKIRAQLIKGKKKKKKVPRSLQAASGARCVLAAA